jgi:flagellar biosynthesis protein FlhB
MAEESEAEDRTEAASARRLQQARDSGDVPLSKELASLAGLGAATLVFAMAVPPAAHTLMLRMAGLMGNAGLWRLDHDGGVAVLRSLAGPVLMLGAPMILAVMIASCAAVLLQSGFVMRTGALMPDLSRLDPRQGLGRIIGFDNLMEAGKSIAKIAILGTILWRSVNGALPLLRQSLLWEPALLADQLTRQVVHLVMMLVAAQGMIAGGDYLWVRLRHARRLRMSKEDLKQEFKETEGNPHIKGKLRQIRHQKARKRMMAAVPKATVVVTNPTHYAIALAYDRGANAAPRVVAKGVDEMAARIRAVAKESGVPLVPNPPLARALYRVELDAEIPAEHFKAVAEIIAYVWRLRQGLRREAA